MPHITRGVSVLAAELVVHPDDDFEVHFEPSNAQLRFARASGPLRHMILDYFATYRDLGMPITDDVLAHMLDSAEAKFERQEGRSATYKRVSSIPANGRHEPVVYYMRFMDTVKIGTTTDVGTRRIAVPCQGVMAIEFGGRELEVQRHREFIDSHKHREWFQLDEHLGSHIAEVREAFEAAAHCTTEVWLERHR